MENTAPENLNVIDEKIQHAISEADRVTREAGLPTYTDLCQRLHAVDLHVRGMMEWEEDQLARTRAAGY